MAKRLTPEDRLRQGAHLPKWLREIPPEGRESYKRYLAQGTKEVREVLKGFEARDGFNLRDIAHGKLTSAQHKKLKEQITRFRHMRSQDTGERSKLKYVRPRSADTLKALERHTGFKDIKRFKKVPVFTDSPDQTKITIRRVKVKIKRGRKIIIRKLPRLRMRVSQPGREAYIDRETNLTQRARPPVSTYFDYFYLPHRNKTWEDFLEQMETLVERLPHGRYRVVSELHGPIWDSMPRSFIMKRMKEWHDQYGTGNHQGLAVVIIGLVRVGSSLKPPITESEPELTRGRLADIGLEIVDKASKISDPRKRRAYVKAAHKRVRAKLKAQAKNKANLIARLRMEKPRKRKAPARKK